VARAGLTGVLLVGGNSSRFGSPKALALLDGETLAERAWRVLGVACEHRLAVGKAQDGLELPFPVLDDGRELRASIVGLAAGLHAAPTDLCVVLPVDCPFVTPDTLHQLADACRDAAVSQMGPLPGAFHRRALPALESGELSIRRAIRSLDTAVVEIDPALLANVNTPAELVALAVTFQR
jgi:molybdopterin-guanine dinucleotide biosynthesis protein A